MAGMLPGVESARRRRFHHSTDPNYTTTSNRSSLCLYAISHNSQINSTTSFEKNRKAVGQAACDADEKLEDVAREAKKRLDQRLQTHWKK